MTDIEKNTKEFRRRLRSAVLTKEWLERTIISLGLYGLVSGVIGPYIIANVNGRMIIRLRPKNFQMSMTDASVTNRRSMAACTKFALFLKSISPVYKVWKEAKIKGNNAFTKIISSNRKNFINESPSSVNTITPEGYSIYAENIITIEKSGKIKINENYSSNDIVIVIAASDPRDKRSESFELIEVNCSPVASGESIKLEKWQKNILRNYKRFIFYSALVRENGKEYEWSNTCGAETELDLTCDYEDAERLGYGQVKSELLITVIPVEVLVKPPG